MFNRFNFANTVLVGLAQSVSVRAERCGRICHKDYKCRLCETNCPVKAIKVGEVGTKISIDWDLCTYCGICTNICPTGVFGLREMSRAAFLDTYLQKASSGVLKLSCKQAQLEEGGYAVFECLGILGAAELLYFYIHSCKEIAVVSGDCSECANKFGLDILKDEVAELAKLAGYFERLKDMRAEVSENKLTLSFPYSFPPKEFAAQPQKKEEPVSRREVFELVGKNIADNAIKSAALLSPQVIPSKTPIRLTKEVTFRRQLFLEGISSMGRITESVVPISQHFFSQEIDAQNCTFCKICTRFCPTGALHCGEGEELLFTAADCSVCGMCLVSCYHKCIKPSKTLDLRDFFNEVIKAKKS
jgi:ferredoxin